MADGGVFAAGSPIPGVSFTLAACAAGKMTKVVCTADVPAIVDRATIKFDEDVTSTTALAGTYTWLNQTTTTVVTNTVVSFSSKVIYFTAFSTALARYDSLRCIVSGVKDSAGNAISATSPVVVTCTVGKASLTALKP